MLAINHEINQHLGGFNAAQAINSSKPQEKKPDGSPKCPAHAAANTLKHVGTVYTPSGKLAALTGVSQNTCATRLRKMEALGIIESKVSGTSRLYRRKTPSKAIVKALIKTFDRSEFTIKNLTDAGYDRNLVRLAIDDMIQKFELFPLGTGGKWENSYRLVMSTTLDKMYLSLITNNHQPRTHKDFAVMLDVCLQEMPNKISKIMRNPKRFPGIQKTEVDGYAAIRFISLKY